MLYKHTSVNVFFELDEVEFLFSVFQKSLSLSLLVFPPLLTNLASSKVLSIIIVLLIDNFFQIYYIEKFQEIEITYVWCQATIRITAIAVVLELP